MRKLAALAILISGSVLVGYAPVAHTQTVSSRFMAFCVDGDGPLSDWVNTRYEAFVAARDHERTARNHRWEIMVHQGETAPRPSACALVGDGPKPETIRLQNKCGRCVRFHVSRSYKDGSIKSRIFTLDSNAKRHFRKLPDTVFTVDAESDCPE